MNSWPNIVSLENLNINGFNIRFMTIAEEEWHFYVNSRQIVERFYYKIEVISCNRVRDDA